MGANQCDMLVQFAHILRKKFEQQGMKQPMVRAEVYVTMNGRGSRSFIDSRVNLAAEQDSFLPKSWILTFTESAQPYSITQK